MSHDNINNGAAKFTDSFIPRPPAPRPRPRSPTPQELARNNHIRRHESQTIEPKVKDESVIMTLQQFLDNPPPAMNLMDIWG